MKNSEDIGGWLVALLFLGRIAAWIGSGIISWNIVDPESFGGAIVFLVAWTAIGYALDFVCALLLAGLANISE